MHEQKISRSETAAKDRNELTAVEEVLSKLRPVLREQYDQTMATKGLAAAKRFLEKDARINVKKEKEKRARNLFL